MHTGAIVKLRIESANINDYLLALPPVIEWNSPDVRAKVQEIQDTASTPMERARLAFLFARDGIQHSFDTRSDLVTINAEDAIKSGEGICFAKSHVLASLLRGLGIPAGFCYQRVLRKTNDPDSGHALHGLNAVYLDGHGWFRVDPRGNKPGVDSQFSIETERLAYPIRPELGEIDYPDVLIAPRPQVLQAMRTTRDCHTLFFDRPESL